MDSGSDGDDCSSGHARAGPSGADLARMQSKIDHLPTIERLLQEEDPNAYTEEQVREAACFVRDLLATEPADERAIEQAMRHLQKRYKKVFKKSLMLAAYRRILEEGAPPAHEGAAADRPSRRQRMREERARRRGHSTLGQDDALEEGGEVEPSVEFLADAVDHRQPTAAPGVTPDLEDLASSPAAPPPPAMRSPVLERYLVFKAPRSQSGVLVVTVFTSPYPDGQRFSCAWNCYYCPNEPNQPRSYLLNEPGVRRANRLEFDPCRQFVDRVESLVAIGHPADKVELLVLGGTWESYPAAYRERFIRDLFYAANTFHEGAGGGSGVARGKAPQWRRPPLDLLHEQLLNEHAKCRIIGVTLETRPDTIRPGMLRELRRLGCTRVQLGVQHTDDAVLAKVNRQATREDTMRAIKLLKDACFKVDIHLMPDLPGATPAIDRTMFDDVLNSPYLQADQWKIYPCQTTPFTVIEEWYRQGLYTPYGLEALIEVLLYAKTRVPPWVRLNRVVRDIPVDYVLAGLEVPNLRQLLALKLRERGQRCQCIRCREVKGDRNLTEKLRTAEMRERVYEASEGTETFLSFETPDEQTIFGFLRLRTNIRNAECPFPELDGCALIRELHVYGNLVPTTRSTGAEAGRCDADGGPHSNGDRRDEAQHTGLGTRLLQRAEALARAAGYERIAVISGVGVRAYYKGRGYRLHAAQGGAYLIKDLTQPEADAVQARRRALAAGAHRLPPALPAAAPRGGRADVGAGLSMWAGQATARVVGALRGAWRRVRGVSRKRARDVGE